MTLASMRREVEKLKRRDASKGGFSILDTWPGMNAPECFRIWCGPDKKTWPIQSQNIAFLDHGFLLRRFHEEIGGGGEPGFFESRGDFPYEMFSNRKHSDFERWWRVICRRSDAIRARRVPDGSKSLYQWLRDVGYDGDGGVNEWPWDVPL